jgi:hypothetical protein
MSTPEHTRGPWKVISEAAAREVEVFEVAEVSHFRVICDGPGDGFDRSGDAFADACLIAAATELLALAKDTQSLINDLSDNIRYIDRVQALEASLGAAIAKATGSTA